ncbi:MAG: sugar ABC transporter permease [Nitriliruptor sp.]|nr:MAG: sugar ABC transporter permease [Nitriliruptor sp.]
MVGDRGWSKAGWIALFLVPSLLPLVAFTVGPMIASIGISTLEWNLISDARFVGLDNYRQLLGDPTFRASLWHTLQYLAGYLPLVFVGGLGLALLLNRGLRGVAFLRSVYFLPVVTSWVVVALVWRWLLSPSGGIVNAGLAAIGIDGPGWWTDPIWAMPSVILASAWKDLGFVMVIFLAGLQGIPGEVEEAALVDGASAWQRFRSVTLPLLSPSSFFVVIISLINGFQVFDQVFVMTGGGPAGATTVVVEQVFTNAFRYGQMGYAAAMSWVLFAIILSVTLFQFRMQRRWVTYV